MGIFDKHILLVNLFDKRLFLKNIEILNINSFEIWLAFNNLQQMIFIKNRFIFIRELIVTMKCVKDHNTITYNF